MYSKKKIFEEQRKIIVELFEIDAADIQLDSNLYEDLDLDSIDAIDMVIKLQEITGKRFKPEDFKSVRTVQDIVDITYELLSK